MGSQFNPAIGAAEGFASGASREYEAGLDFVTRLRAAAQQQQQHDDMMRQESFKNALELAGKGAVPLTQDPTGGTIAKGGLGKRTVDNPAAAGVEGMTVTDPQGRQYKIPDANQKAADKLTDANSFTLTDELAKEAGSMGSALKVGQRYPLTVLEHLNTAAERTRAAGEKSSEFQTRDKERQEAAEARQDARTESARRYAQTEKDRQDARTESQRRYEEARADRTERQAQSQQAAQDREEAKAQAARDRAQVAIDKYQKDEQTQHGIRQQFGDLLAAKKGEVVTDPITKKPVKIGDHPDLDVARRRVWTEKYQTATDQVQRLQNTQKQLITRMGGGTEETTAAPVKSGKPLTDPKIATQFLQQAGGDKDKARALAKAAGWDF